MTDQECAEYKMNRNLAMLAAARLSWERDQQEDEEKPQGAQEIRRQGLTTDSARNSEATEEAVDTAVRLYLGQDQAAQVEQTQSTQEHLYITAPDTNIPTQESAVRRAKKTRNPTNNHHNSSCNLKTYTICTRICGKIRGAL